MFSRAGDFFRYEYNFAEALRLEEKAYTIYNAVCGPINEATLWSMDRRAIILRGLGRFQDAVSLEEDALKASRAHWKTLWSMGNLALLYSTISRGSEAAKLAEDALDLSKTTLTEEHTNTLWCMGNLTMIYGQTGRSLDALKIQKKALEVSYRMLGEQSKDTLRNMDNLSLLLGHLDKYDEAIVHASKAVEVTKKMLGHAHYRTLKRMLSLYIFADMTEKPQVQDIDVTYVSTEIDEMLQKSRSAVSYWQSEQSEARELNATNSRGCQSDVIPNSSRVRYFS
jgi:tetratricopeptide (TPR) repeat protein